MLKLPSRTHKRWDEYGFKKGKDESFIAWDFDSRRP